VAAEREILRIVITITIISLNRSPLQVNLLYNSPLLVEFAVSKPISRLYIICKMICRRRVAGLTSYVCVLDMVINYKLLGPPPGVYVPVAVE
jgi:hypothetical protein